MKELNEILSSLECLKIDLNYSYASESETYQKNKKDEIIKKIQEYYFNKFLSILGEKEIKNIKMKEIYKKNNKKTSIFHSIATFLAFLFGCSVLGSLLSMLMYLDDLNKMTQIVFLSLSIMLVFIISIFSSLKISDYFKLKRDLFLEENINFNKIIKQITMETIENIQKTDFSNEKIKEDLKQKIVNENYKLEKKQLNILSEVKEILLNESDSSIIASKKILEKEMLTYENQLDFLRKEKIK